MAAHGIQAAGAEIFLHARTRMARTRPLQERFADAKTHALESRQIDPRDDKIASQLLRPNLAADQIGHHGDVLGLDQRHLALPASRA